MNVKTLKNESLRVSNLYGGVYTDIFVSKHHFSNCYERCVLIFLGIPRPETIVNFRVIIKSLGPRCNEVHLASLPSASGQSLREYGCPGGRDHEGQPH